MPKAIERIGRRYRKMVVLRQLTKLPYPQMGIWECRCDCGKIIERTAKQLDNSMSCGCARLLAAKVRGKKQRRGTTVTINHAYRSHKQNAKFRNIAWLNKADWEKLVFLPCHYCNEISNKQFSSTNNPNVRPEDNVVSINGVDRKDSKGDYSIENCVPCCPRCNQMKLELSSHEFIAHIQSIYHHLN